MSDVSVTPDPFVLVQYDAAAIRALVADVAARVGVPADVAVSVTIDEALPRPLIASYVDVVGEGDGREISLWCSGGNFEHPQYPRRFDDERAPSSLAVDLIRAADRLGGCAAAPDDADLTDRQREAWATSASGRAARLGFDVREPLVRYHFRLANGFGDAVDAVFEQLWRSDGLTWDELEAACAETQAADGRPAPKPRPGAGPRTLRDTGASPAAAG